MPPASPAAHRGPARALKALRRFSRLVTEAETPEALSRDLCRVLVEDCGYRLAWVGLARKDADASIEPIASYGFEDGYLQGLRVSSSDETERGRGPTGVCVREGRACVALDMQTDPRLAPWREDALRRGYRSSAAIPLGKAAPARGALSVYAAEPGAFGAEELELLEELATGLDRGLCALKAREERAVLALALEQSSDAVMLTDSQGNILLVNLAFEELTGFTRADVFGRNPRLLKSGVMPPDYYERMWKCLRAGKVWTGRVSNRRKDGTLYTADCQTAPVKTPGGTVTFFVCVQHDVTREAALQEALLQAQKMEAVGRLAGGVAHDFNNQLTVIMGYSESLLGQVRPDSQPWYELDEINRAARHAAVLTRRLLAFSRRQALQLETISLNEVVHQVEGLLGRLIGEDIAIEVHLAESPGQIKADAVQLEQVLLNLAVNARDAMPGGGRLVIETAPVNLTEHYHKASPVLVRPGRYVMLAVTDTGCGMDVATRARVFEPFFTTKEQGKGTGLGLSTVYGIVKQLGGYIWVYSEPDIGSTFKLYFPLAGDTMHASESAVTIDTAPNGSETILLVEDEDAVRQFSASLLRRHGYRVLEAGSGEEALRIAERPEPIDLVLTDVVMPGLSGPEMLARLRASRPMKGLYMSGYTERVLRAGLLRSQGTLIEKPFGPAELLRRVRQTLDAPSTEPAGAPVGHA